MTESNSKIEFIRALEVESIGVELEITQYFVGDVGAVVWDAGIVLGKYLDNLQKRTAFLSAKKVIDIGSGTGVAGLFAAALGAEVILTDLPEFIPLLEKNIILNRNAMKGVASASVLIWGEDQMKFPVADLILVSDCIYYDMSVEKLVPTLVRLANSSTEVLISYEDRTTGNKRDLLKSFLEALEQDFHIEYIPLSLLHPDFQSPDIHILKCKKR